MMENFGMGTRFRGPSTVDVYMTKLRSKFSGCTDFEILTVHGLGYKAVIR